MSHLPVINRTLLNLIDQIMRSPNRSNMLRAAMETLADLFIPPVAGTLLLNNPLRVFVNTVQITAIAQRRLEASCAATCRLVFSPPYPHMQAATRKSRLALLNTPLSNSPLGSILCPRRDPQRDRPELEQPHRHHQHASRQQALRSGNCQHLRSLIGLGSHDHS
jgi:hypothetical protein